jgi:uncharacterized protein (TIGR03435 family)
MRAMWRAFAAERMKLAAHDETTERPIYNLVLARSDGRLGPKLKRSAYDCEAEIAAAVRQTGTPAAFPQSDAEFLDTCAARFSSGRILGGGLTMERLAEQLRDAAGRVVRDRTGLTGFYVVDFTYARPTQAGAPPASVAADPNEAVSVFTALQEQLGLKLETDRMPIQHVVIDHIERPSGN